jgi:RNA polymerase sigma-70 factor (ECF subfamily)
VSCISENIIVRKAAEGDGDAFRWLVEKYQHMVYTIALNLLEHPQEAEDLAQEIFLKCHNALPKFRGDSSFSTWLYSIAWRKSIDRKKVLQRNGRKFDLDEAAENYEILDSMHPENNMDAKTLTIILNKAIDRLPAEDRVLLTLFYFEELSLKEIAAIQDTTEGNTKIRLYRIRQKLYGLLKNHPNLLQYFN